jgi:hypothetical protein
MILTVCQYGHSRSVAAARELHARGIDAVACGFGTAGEWFPLLCHAAEQIIIMDDTMMMAVPLQERHKVAVCHVGADTWSNPYNRELAALIRAKIDACLAHRVSS